MYMRLILTDKIGIDFKWKKEHMIQMVNFLTHTK